MFLSSLIEELCTKEENNEAGSTFTFGGQCTFKHLNSIKIFTNDVNFSGAIKVNPCKN